MVPGVSRAPLRGWSRRRPQRRRRLGSHRGGSRRRARRRGRHQACRVAPPKEPVQGRVPLCVARCLSVILVASIGALAGSTASTRPALAASCDPIQTPPTFAGPGADRADRARLRARLAGGDRRRGRPVRAGGRRCEPACRQRRSRDVLGRTASALRAGRDAGARDARRPGGDPRCDPTPARPRHAPGRGRPARRGHPGDPLADGQRPRRRGERHRCAASRPLRARGPHGLRRDADPRQRARRDHPDAEPGRPRGRAAAERLLLRHEPRLVRPDAARDRGKAGALAPVPGRHAHRRPRDGREPLLLPTGR